jgi:hypothetical protein
MRFVASLSPQYFPDKLVVETGIVLVTGEAVLVSGAKVEDEKEDEIFDGVAGDVGWVVDDGDSVEVRTISVGTNVLEVELTSESLENDVGFKVGKAVVVSLHKTGYCCGHAGSLGLKHIVVAFASFQYRPKHTERVNQNLQYDE